MTDTAPDTTKAQDISRQALAAMLTSTGIGHLTFLREPFKAQVPNFIPLAPETTLALSGVAELLLAATLLTPPRHRRLAGLIAGAFS